VVLGHWIAYVATVPATGVRETFLAQTGHAYWPTAVAVAVVLGIVATAGTIVRHLRIGALTRVSLPGSWEHYRVTALRLAGLQASVFVVQEVVERVHVGSPLSGLLHGGFLAAGLAVQVLVAGVLAVVLTWLGRAAEAIGRALTSSMPLRRVRHRFLVRASQVPVRVAVRGLRSSRGPPRLAVRIA
jgi:hypothetical protein